MKSSLMLPVVLPSPKKKEMVPVFMMIAVPGPSSVAVQMSTPHEGGARNRLDPVNVGESPTLSVKKMFSALADWAANTKQTINKLRTTVAFRNTMLFPPRSALLSTSAAFDPHPVWTIPAIDVPTSRSLVIAKPT